MTGYPYLLFKYSLKSNLLQFVRKFQIRNPTLCLTFLSVLYPKQMSAIISQRPVSCIFPNATINVITTLSPTHQDLLFTTLLLYDKLTHKEWTLALLVRFSIKSEIYKLKFVKYSNDVPKAQVEVAYTISFNPQCKN